MLCSISSGVPRVSSRTATSALARRARTPSSASPPRHACGFDQEVGAARRSRPSVGNGLLHCPGAGRGLRVRAPAVPRGTRRCRGGSACAGSSRFGGRARPAAPRARSRRSSCATRPGRGSAPARRHRPPRPSATLVPACPARHPHLGRKHQRRLALAGPVQPRLGLGRNQRPDRGRPSARGLRLARRAAWRRRAPVPWPTAAPSARGCDRRRSCRTAGRAVAHAGEINVRIIGFDPELQVLDREQPHGLQEPVGRRRTRRGARGPPQPPP